MAKESTREGFRAQWHLPLRECCKTKRAAYEREPTQRSDTRNGRLRDEGPFYGFVGGCFARDKDDAAGDVVVAAFVRSRAGHCVARLRIGGRSAEGRPH